MNNNQIADRLMILKTDVEASIINDKMDEDLAAGKKLRLARFVLENHNAIIAALRRKE
jgi:hypothetical protein